jgi:hypothetical protein
MGKQRNRAGGSIKVNRTSQSEHEIYGSRRSNRKLKILHHGADVFSIRFRSGEWAFRKVPYSAIVQQMTEKQLDLEIELLDRLQKFRAGKA